MMASEGGEELENNFYVQEKPHRQSFRAAINILEKKRKKIR